MDLFTNTLLEKAGSEVTRLSKPASKSTTAQRLRHYPVLYVGQGGPKVDNNHHVAGKDMCVGFLCRGAKADVSPQEISRGPLLEGSRAGAAALLALGEIPKQHFRRAAATFYFTKKLRIYDNNNPGFLEFLQTTCHTRGFLRFVVALKEIFS